MYNIFCTIVASLLPFKVLISNPVDKQVSGILELLKAQLPTTIIFQILAVSNKFLKTNRILTKKTAS